MHVGPNLGFELTQLLIVLDSVSDQHILSIDLVLALGGQPVHETIFRFVEQVEFLTVEVVLEELLLEVGVVLGAPVLVVVVRDEIVQGTQRLILEHFFGQLGEVHLDFIVFKLRGGISFTWQIFLPQNSAVFYAGRAEVFVLVQIQHLNMGQAKLRQFCNLQAHCLALLCGKPSSASRSGALYCLCRYLHQSVSDCDLIHSSPRPSEPAEAYR